MSHDCKTCPVLSDAKAENAELRARVRAARRELARLVNTQFDHTDAIVIESNVFDVLDLRKPLPRRKR